jgi:hypothetical protein
MPILIGVTDVQDLLTELGGPDAVLRKHEDKLRIHATDDTEPFMPDDESGEYFNRHTIIHLTYTFV